MDNSSKKVNFIISVIFIGLVLSGMLYIMLTTYMSSDDAISPEYIKKNADVNEYPLMTELSDTVYKNKLLEKYIVTTNYVLFRELPDSGIIVGYNDFLFEMENRETGYSYIKDYLGELKFTRAELELIAENLQKLRTDYRENGKELKVVVIPDQQTVYSEYMPMYIGQMSEETSLSQLEKYLKNQEIDYFYDLTDNLMSCKENGYLYNNTENSLTALGAYYVYRNTMEIIGSGLPMYDEDKLSFYIHMTDGKSIAQSAGIESVVMNRTISLSSNFEQTYRITKKKNIHKTYTEYLHRSDVTQGNYLMLQFDNEQTLLQLMPYFSNTYSNVTYKLVTDTDTAETNPAQTVVRFISENDLRQLLVSP